MEDFVLRTRSSAIMEKPYWQRAIHDASRFKFSFRSAVPINGDCRLDTRLNLDARDCQCILKECVTGRISRPKLSPSEALSDGSLRYWLFWYRRKYATARGDCSYPSFGS